jgi:hypothetical protein
MNNFCFKTKFPKLKLISVWNWGELAINNVSKGFHPDETLNLLRRLQRPLPPGEDTITLFGGNFEKEM